MATLFGYNKPFFGGHQNVLSLQEDDRLIKNDLLILLNTVPGELDMLPEFGCGLRSALFDLSTDSDVSSVTIDVENAIYNFEPRVNNVVVSIIRNDARHAWQVNVSCVRRDNPLSTIEVETFIALGN